MGAYWFAVRWVAFLDVSLDAHIPTTVVVPTVFQELRSWPGSLCP